MAFVHQTDLWHQDNDLASQQRRSLLKQRISDLKQEQTNLYIEQPLSDKSDDECYQEIAAACDQFIKDPSAKNEQKLAATLEEHNLQLYCYPADITSKDKKDVARMAFNGYVDRPQEYQLSPIVRQMKNKPLERQHTTPQDYDLSYSSVWNVFKQVPEFAAIEEQVKKSLAVFGIPPQELPKLQVKDFCYLINEQMRSNAGGGAVKVFNESYKARHTKRFIAENEDEFRKGLLAMPGVQPEYVNTLIRAMKRGVTDLSKYKENGVPVWKEEWADQPVIDVHHIVNIKDSATKEAEGKSFTNINDYENMCFIVRYPEHDAMHALEQDLQGNYHEDIFRNRQIGTNMFYRIQPPPGVRCMLGFHNMIYDRKYLDLPEKEKKNVEARAQNNPHRITGQHGRNGRYDNNAKNPYYQRREWTNKGRYNV
ncbi:MAG: hypothetical protein J6X42_05025 [Alphaproteobacteria bacterium]|nr:hypothetical protein [Alphaproteobacteria bacterium]